MLKKHKKCNDSNNKISYIKFKQSELGHLKRRLLADTSKEYYAVLLAKKETLNNITIYKVIESRYLDQNDYIKQSGAFLHLKKDLFFSLLQEILDRLDIDSIVDVHTHPFAENSVRFSHVDDNDEESFFKFLTDRFSDINYASIVLSKNDYSARIWQQHNNIISHTPAIVKTQSALEAIPSADFIKKNSSDSNDILDNDIYSRSILALGYNTMKSIISDSVISIIGVGGIGSILAENLVHYGFPFINLIDHDIVEKSNLNRLVGAYYDDAENNELKVNAIKNHLQKINPKTEINSFPINILETKIDNIIALSDWVILSTDNHSSRYVIQELCLNYYTPFISIGTNITVNNNKIIDMSGEVITIRAGDKLCLNCLGRINHIKIGHELHPEKQIQQKLEERGYVEGINVKEPAVKSINSILANIATETLLNQYTGRQKHRPITVYENNSSMTIYEDRASTDNRIKNCFYCNI